MGLQTKKTSLALTLALALALPAHTVAQNKKTELNTINKNIADIKTDLRQSNIKKSVLQNSLAQTEISESQIDQALKKTQETISLQEEKLQTLEAESVPLRAAKNQNQTLLKQQIRAAYMLNQQPYLKLLLAPNDIAETRRLMMYFHYITEAQMQTMKKLQHSLTACEENQKAIQNQVTRLSALKKAQIDNQQALQKVQAQRQQFIQAINQHIETKQQKLASLMHDKQRLEATLVALTEKISKAVFSNKPFATQRGKMPWPLQGHIRHQFGTQVYQSELKWDGVLINAKPGDPVRAVAAGSVIFSKWMAGYGLLLIINHGNGYMTLYGRNQTITKKVGDAVSAGEVIGTAGKSGGFQNPGLYFSIRHNAQALNPSHWCS